MNLSILLERIFNRLFWTAVDAGPWHLQKKASEKHLFGLQIWEHQSPAPEEHLLISHGIIYKGLVVHHKLYPPKQSFCSPTQNQKKHKDQKPQKDIV